jgi:transcriptional regulator with XRE-family HTH domain
MTDRRASSRGETISRCDVCGRDVRVRQPTTEPGVRLVLRCKRCDRRSEHRMDVPTPGSGAEAGIPTTRKRQQAWMQRLGEHVRRTRELLGLTQGQLAELSATSQAAVSRLEQGNAMGTTYLVVLSIQNALCTKLHELATLVPGTEVGALLDHSSMLPELADSQPRPHVAITDELSRYVAVFRGAPAVLQAQLLTIVESVAARR